MLDKFKFPKKYQTLKLDVKTKDKKQAGDSR